MCHPETGLPCGNLKHVSQTQLLIATSELQRKRFLEISSLERTEHQQSARFQRLKSSGRIISLTVQSQEVCRTGPEVKLGQVNVKLSAHKQYQKPDNVPRNNWRKRLRRHLRYAVEPPIRVFIFSGHIKLCCGCSAWSGRTYRGNVLTNDLHLKRSRLQIRQSSAQ